MRTISYTVSLMTLAIVSQSSGIIRAQSPLERLESGIRGGSGTVPAAPLSTQLPPPLPTPAGAPPAGITADSIRPIPSGARGYLGAIVDDRNELGRGLRVLSVAAGGPADRAGVKPHDLIYGAGGTRVRQMRDITVAMSRFGPGDKVALDILRGIRMTRIEVVLGSSPSQQTPQPTPAELPLPPVPGAVDAANGATRSSVLRPVPAESIPVPPVDPSPLAPPSIDATKPSGPMLESPDTRVEALQKKIDSLEQRIERLERELAEARKKP